MKSMVTKSLIEGNYGCTHIFRSEIDYANGYVKF